MTLTPQFPRDGALQKNSLDADSSLWKVKGLYEGRHSHRLKVKRAKELELVVVDKRAKRKESRVLDSNGESGALGGLRLSCERGGKGKKGRGVQ